jgi:hypothetical protein
MRLHDKQEVPGVKAELERAPYSSPQLTELGDVRDLTLGGSGHCTDYKNGKQSHPLDPAAPGCD